MTDPRLASRNIVADFPEMFYAAFDVSLPNGWYSVVWDCCARIHGCAPETRVNQIKEKFGGLCIYLEHAAPDEVREIINRAVKQCARICQVCGKPGALGQKRGWASTRCEECRSEQA